MGDRANIHIANSQTDNGVYLYTHWCGTELPHTLKNALLSKQRWNDTSYLTRIIFCEMIDGQTIRRNDRTWSFEEYINLSDEEIDRVWYEEQDDEN